MSKKKKSRAVVAPTWAPSPSWTPSPSPWAPSPPTSWSRPAPALSSNPPAPAFGSPPMPLKFGPKPLMLKPTWGSSRTSTPSTSPNPSIESMVAISPTSSPARSHSRSEPKPEEIQETPFEVSTTEKPAEDKPTPEEKPTTDGKIAAELLADKKPTFKGFAEEKPDTKKPSSWSEAQARLPKVIDVISCKLDKEKFSQAPCAVVPASAPLEEHSRHNYLDGSLKFRVENVLYRIHHHIINTSPVLVRLVYGDEAPTSPHQNTPLPSKPTITLDSSVKSVELDALLDLVYTPFYAVNKLSAETYRLALPLCIKWRFNELRDTILTRLEGTLEVIDRYTLARELHISGWEEASLIELISRSTGLTLSEGRRLGVEDVIFISAQREGGRTRGQCLHTCVSCDPKKRLSGEAADTAFVQKQVKEWIGRAK